MALEDMKIKISFDADGFKKSVSNINNQIKTATQEFKTAAAQMGDFAIQTDKLKLKQESLQKQLSLQAEKVKLLNEAYEQSKSTKGEDAKQTQSLYNELLKAQEQEGKFRNQLIKTNGDLQNQSEKVQIVETNFKSLSEKLNETGDKLKQTGEKLQKSGKEISGIGKNITTGVTVPIAAIATSSIKLAMDFDSTMSKVKSSTGTTGEEFKVLEDKAREMGAKTSKSATEAAEAINYMGLAGFNTTQIVEAIEPVLRLSEAGGMDLASASDLVTDSMAALGIETKDLQGYLDKMAQTSVKSNSDVSDLAEAFITCGGMLKNLNVPLDESNALLGVLANRGLKGSEAGNSLSSVLINITSGAGQAGTAMKELQLSAFNEDGSFKGVTQTLIELKEKLKGMTDEQVNMYLSMIGGKTQISTLNALLDGVGNEYGQLREDIQNSDGALLAMAKTIQDNTKGAIEELKSGIEEAGISIGKALIPYVNQLVEKLQGAVDWFNGLSESHKQMILVIAGVAAAIGPLIIIFGTLISSLGSIISVAGTVVGGLTSVGGVMGLLLNPVTLVVGAIAGLLLLLASLGTDSVSLNDVVSSCVENIKEIITAAFDLINQTIQYFKDEVLPQLQKSFEQMLPAIQTVIEAITYVVKGIFDFIKDEIFPPLQEIMSFFIEKILPVFVDTIKTSLPLVSDAFKALWDIIKSVLQNIMDEINVALPILEAIFQNTFNSLANIFSVFVGVVSGLIQLIAGVLTGDWEQAWNGFKTIFESIFNGIKQSLENTIEGISNMISGISESISRAMDKINIFNNKKVENKTVEVTERPIHSGAGADIPAYATGTSFHTGGFALVGELGPELVNLPRGSQVLNSNKTQELLERNNQSVTNNFNIANVTVREEADIQKISEALYQRQLRGMREVGVR